MLLMDSMNQVLSMWGSEFLIAIAIMSAAGLMRYANRLKSAPLEAVLSMILGASIGATVAGVFLTHRLFGLHLSTRALWFIALYVWCVLGMLFIASRNTHKFKLFLGLVSQAGILYTLFIFC